MFGVVVRGAGAVVHFSSVRRCYIHEVLWFCSRQSGPTRSGPKESGRVLQFRTLIWVVQGAILKTNGRRSEFLVPCRQVTQTQPNPWWCNCGRRHSASQRPTVQGELEIASILDHASSTRTRRGGSCLRDIYKTFLIYRTCMRRAPAKPVRACIL